MQRFNDLDIIIPISLDNDWQTKDAVIAEIREQNELYGFTRFALTCPGGGWRSIGYPPSEFFSERAECFSQIKEAVKPYGIDCGWWITATVKSGHLPEGTPIIKEDGSVHPFANCPLDPVFRHRLASDMALFAKIGKPSFIITEDDYAISAASASGCFCTHHLKEFSRREGKTFTREQLTEQLRSMTEEGYALLKRWRMLSRDSLVGLAREIRRAVDMDSPEIPIGYMQSGGCDLDGDCTEAICRALAGPNHVPFSRLFGAFYGGVSPRDIPSVLYHPFYSKQHIKEPFVYYHESDTFPHTRFFTSGRDMLPLMGAAYSMGFDGSTFQTQQLLDHANEETAYGNIFRAERKRMNAIHKAAKQCQPCGAQICYDPFWNSLDPSGSRPLWTKAVSMFGIPWITTESNVVFWDSHQAKHCDEQTIMHYLAKPLLFLDGEAASVLCDRGFGEYLGVSLGRPINNLPENNMLQWDLGAREVIRESFITENTGRHMPSAHMLAPGNGKMLQMEITDPACEILTDMYTYDKRYITPSMTCYKNSLGGTVIVMSITLRGNQSQSLLNYRRQRLIQSLIAAHCDEFVHAQESPCVFTIMNEAVNAESAGFSYMLTLINLSNDPLSSVHLHIPPAWREADDIQILRENGEWETCTYISDEDGIKLQEVIESFVPTCLLFHK